MGWGIAQLGCLGGFETVLHDPIGEALEAGAAKLHAALGQGRRARALVRGGGRRGRGAPARDPVAGGPGRLRAGHRGGARAPRAQARALRGAGTSLRRRGGAGNQHLVALGDRDRGRRSQRPERVCGMHFFNPPALMKLVEVVAGDATAEPALALVTEVATAMGRTPDSRRRRDRLRRQPLRPAVLAGGAAALRRRDLRAASRSTGSCGSAAATGWGRSS